MDQQSVPNGRGENDRPDRYSRVLVKHGSPGFAGLRILLLQSKEYIFQTLIQRDRQIGNKVTTEVHHCYIMSKQLSAAEVLDIARKYWEVENKHHWRLDGVPQAHRIAA